MMTMTANLYFVSSMKIAVDFDGTCVRHRFPKVGEDVPYAVDVLKRLVQKGHQLILYTMRSDIDEVKQDEPIEGIEHPHGGNYLTEAIEWFKKHDIPLYAIQKDIGQEDWTKSNKCYAQMYIDDAALGCPLIFPFQDRPYVDWHEVANRLSQRGIL